MSEENKLVVTESAELVPADQATKSREVLKQESTALLAKLATETNLDKTKDLTYLFNVNHNKKALVRQEVLDDVQDNVVNLIAKRVNEHSDEMDTETLLKTATALQSIMDKNSMQVNQPVDQPLININKTDININQPKEEIDPMLSGLTATQRKHVSTFMSSIFKNAQETITPADDVIEVEVIDDEK